MNLPQKLAFVFLITGFSSRIFQATHGTKTSRSLLRTSEFYESKNVSEFFNLLLADFDSCHKMVKSSKNGDEKLRRSVLDQMQLFKNMLFFKKDKPSTSTPFELIRNPYTVGSPSEAIPKTLSFVHRIYSVIHQNQGEGCNQMLETLMQIVTVFVGGSKKLRIRIGKIKKELKLKKSEEEKTRTDLADLESSIEQLAETKKDDSKIKESKKEQSVKTAKLRQLRQEIEKMENEELELNSYFLALNSEEKANAKPNKNGIAGHSPSQPTKEQIESFCANCRTLIHIMERKKTDSEIDKKAKRLLSKLALKMVLVFKNTKTGVKEAYESSGFLIRKQSEFKTSLFFGLEMTHFISSQHCFQFADEYLGTFDTAVIKLINDNKEVLHKMIIAKADFRKYFWQSKQDKCSFDEDFYSLHLPTPIKLMHLPESTIRVFPPQSTIMELIKEVQPKVYVAAFPSSNHLIPKGLSRKVDWKDQPESELNKLSIVELTEFSELPKEQAQAEPKSVGFFSSIIQFLTPCVQRPNRDNPAAPFVQKDLKKLSRCTPGTSKCFGQTLRGMSGGITVEVHQKKKKIEMLIIGIHGGVDCLGRTVITRRYDLSWID